MIEIQRELTRTEVQMISPWLEILVILKLLRKNNSAPSLTRSHGVPPITSEGVVPIYPRIDFKPFRK